MTKKKDCRISTTKFFSVKESKNRNNNTKRFNYFGFGQLLMNSTRKFSVDVPIFNVISGIHLLLPYFLLGLLFKKISKGFLEKNYLDV